MSKVIMGNGDWWKLKVFQRDSKETTKTHAFMLSLNSQFHALGQWGRSSKNAVGWRAGYGREMKRAGEPESIVLKTSFRPLEKINRFLCQNVKILVWSVSRYRLSPARFSNVPTDRELETGWNLNQTTINYNSLPIGIVAYAVKLSWDNLCRKQLYKWRFVLLTRGVSEKF